MVRLLFFMNIKIKMGFLLWSHCCETINGLLTVISTTNNVT